MIAIIDYGVGNLKSVHKGLLSVGADAVITSDKKVIENADKLVLPGVGAFRDAIHKLNECELIEPIKKCVKSGKYLMGICLGMQLLMTTSYENGVYQGLDIIKGDVVKFNHNLKIPHMGWNDLDIVKSDPIWQGIDKMMAYFVHSFYIPSDNSATAAVTNYGNDFSSALIQDNVYAFQFHPEKSSDSGLKILKNFGELK